MLAVEVFGLLADAQIMTAAGRADYNERRPHSALDMDGAGQSTNNSRRSGPMTGGIRGHRHRPPAKARRTLTLALVRICFETLTDRE